MKIAITAATGQLGKLVIEQLLAQHPASEIIAVVRDAAKAESLSACGIGVRLANYDDQPALERAFVGVDKVLLISGNEIGRRAEQHRRVIAAARHAGVQLFVYTSLLRADATPLSLGLEHAETEIALRTSGIPYIILRNGWYHENYTASVPAALAHGALVGSAGNGRIASAARSDYAAAAVASLTGRAETGRTYELAGDDAYSLTEFAAEISRQTGKSIPYVNLPESEYAGILLQAGLPLPLANAIASGDTGASQGALFDDGRQLSGLIGRPTTSIADAVAASLQKL